MSLLITGAYSTPVYYTFEGTLKRILVDGFEGGYFLPSKWEGHKVGEVYSLTFMLETSMRGVIQSPYVGTISATNWDDPKWTSYYAEYVSGSAFQYGTRQANEPKTNYLYAIHYHNREYYPSNGLIFNVSNPAHPGYDEIHFGTATPLKEWEIGVTKLAGINYAEYYLTSGTRVWVENWTNDLVLTRVSDHPPVPEPSSILLSLLGLGFIGFKLKRKRV